MKLWESILIGTKKGPQTFWQYFDFGLSEGSCALGAACLATGVSSEALLKYSIIPYLAEKYPIMRATAQCPLSCEKTKNIGYSQNVGEIIIHLNDHHNWSRECIAYWLRDNVQEPIPEETSPPVKSGVETEAAVIRGPS
jgi:hypothetical protein